MSYYARRLPHWQVVGRPLFVTFRLHGTLPANRIFPPAHLTSGQAFAAIDRILDQARTGVPYLRRPEIAHMVVQAITDGEARFHRYDLHAFVVMPNHVHLLITPRVPAAGCIGPLKGFTGHRAAKLLPLGGSPFWQDESYDHLVRDDAEFERVKGYIEYNPVRAGLVASPEEFPWSSACRNSGRQVEGQR